MPRLIARIVVFFGLMSPLGVQGCTTAERAQYPAADGALRLTRVVLFRNGVGYFERGGVVEGDRFTIKIRKDAVDDLLKSLTVVERTGGRAVSISMPLDPQTWVNAAQATLGPGRGSLAEVLDALRGTRVTVATTEGTVSGRIVMVEEITAPPDDAGRLAPPPQPVQRDHQITLINESTLHVVRLSRVKALTLQDGDLVMQLHRSLDAAAGEGMFQQVEVAIRLSSAKRHDLLVSYVVEAPIWKPTYRLVLPENGQGKALLQGWAVIDNTSGEDWQDVRLSLTSGAPIAFRYDLHTPRVIERPDLTEAGVRRRARPVVGEATFGEGAAGPAPPAADAAGENDAGDVARSAARALAPAPLEAAGGTAFAAPQGLAAVDPEALRRSILANARAGQASGLVRFDLQDPVTVRDGTSTMVPILNADVEAEETFLYRPEGAGVGYEANPYRVVRFRNTTPFVLEPGPTSIYSAGSFVGEGLSEVVGTMTSATIPFAVEPGIIVSSTVTQDNEQMRLLRIVRGVLEVETFARTTTVWTARLQKAADRETTILIRQRRAGDNYELSPRPEGTEDLPGAFLVPLRVPVGAVEGTVQVIQQTPSRMSIAIWDERALPLLETLLVSTTLTPELRVRLEPIVQRRQEIGRIDTRLEGLRRQQAELDQRAGEIRQSLEALKNDTAPAAAALRQRLGERLEQLMREAEGIGREIVELQTRRLDLRLELEDALQNLELNPPEPAAASPEPG